MLRELYEGWNCVFHSGYGDYVIRRALSIQHPVFSRWPTIQPLSLTTACHFQRVTYFSAFQSQPPRVMTHHASLSRE